MTRIAFEKLQATIEQAALCAKVHTETSCDGIPSHGLNRVARFVRAVMLKSRRRKWRLAGDSLA